MKRRLDLALALVHHPRILFLDEPTTGLDPQSRNALWDEVGRLAKEEGVTVFLTTQYLEEADVLADRVGIIDHGHIVAEGTPTELKAEIGRPTVEVVPADPEQRDRFADDAPPLRRARPALARQRRRPLRARRATTSRRSSARSTPRASTSPTSSFTRRASTTSSSRRPAGRSRARPPRPTPRPRRRPRERRPGLQIYQLARRSVVRQSRQPANVVAPVIFPLGLLAVNAGGLQPATMIPGFPTDRFVAFALASRSCRARCSRR